MDTRNPLAIAHRGSHNEHPENSIPAILRSLEFGAQGVEIDVHAASDGVLVVHHDPDLSDGRMISEMRGADVLFFELAPGVRIPSLDEVLDIVAGRATLFIETKVEGVEFALIRAIRNSAADCAVHSFHHQTIATLKTTMPALRVGVLTTGSAENAIRALRSTNADDLWHEAPLVTPGLIEECHRLGKAVIAWTANSTIEMARLTNLGVDGICTDDVEALTAVLR